jgi:erythrocyte band 7 integral membrane protein
MRQAANILSSAPAMQIRYLEAMQAMAKSANSKVIFMPGPTDSGSLSLAKVLGDEGSSSQSSQPSHHQVDPVQHAVNAHVLEEM